MNKIDLNHIEAGVERDEYDKITRIKLSAKTGAGIALLRDMLVEKVTAFKLPAVPSASRTLINNEYHPELD